MSPRSMVKETVKAPQQTRTRAGALRRIISSQALTMQHHCIQKGLCAEVEAPCRTNRRRQYIVDEWIDAFDLPLSDHLKKSQPVGLFNGSWSWRDVGERIAYKYFCWR